MRNFILTNTRLQVFRYELIGPKKPIPELKVYGSELVSRNNL